MERQDKKQEHLLDLQWVRRALLLALFDIGIIIASSLLALMARFDFSYAGIEVANRYCIEFDYFLFLSYVSQSLEICRCS